MKRAKIYMYERYAGMLREDENGFSFVYDPSYLPHPDADPIRLSMPLLFFMIYFLSLSSIPSKDSMLHIMHLPVLL